MTAGFLTATCLCFVLSQEASEVWYTNRRDPEIPVTIDANRRADIRELLLYASTDQGRNWAQAGTITPDKGKFIFYAAKDTTYWLRVAFVNKAGVQEPDDKSLMRGPPDSKLVVDTLKPIVRTILAQREGDDIAVQWDVQEDNPDLSKDGMRLEYQAKDQPGESWTPIPISQSLKGQARFRATTKQPPIIRLTVRDLAKNSSHGFAETTGPVQVASFTPNTGGGTPTLPAEIQLPKRPIDDGKPIVMPPPMTDVFGPKTPILPPPPLKEIESPVRKTTFGNSEPLIAPPLKEAPKEKVIADTSTPPPPVEQPKTVPTQDKVPGAPDAAHSGKPVAVSATVQRVLPPVQYVNNHQVVLEYKVNRVGPSGVGGIELWLTKDDGESWERFAEIPDLSSMKTEEIQEIQQIQKPQKRKFELELEPKKPLPDGVYGMILVVKNRAGLGKKPRPGDIPEMRLEIDTKHPDAQLYQPVPDPQHSDHVLLRWSAEDKNLATQPITLEYAEKRDGPWMPIQTDVANIGQFSWKVPPSTPVQVYLRLRVRDKAGNEGVAVTGQPQYVDLTEPEGALIGVQSQSKRP